MKMYEAIVGKSNYAVEQRKQFLQEFENNGGGKGKDGLKWVLSYEKTCKSEDTKSVSCVENHFTRSQLIC